MLKSLYNAIRQDAAPFIYGEEDRKYSDKKLYPLKQEEPDLLQVTSLESVCDYVEANLDNLDLTKLVLVVNSPTQVSLCSELKMPFSQRFTYLQANLLALTLPIGQYYESEEFNVLVQATMANVFDKEKLLRYIANIKSVGEIGIYDDGTAQQITVKKGIAAVEKDVLPNPVTLAPFRTFHEIEQPESQFIFRVKEENGKFLFQLTEADGGKWKNNAHLRIKNYFLERLPDLHIIS